MSKQRIRRIKLSKNKAAIIFDKRKPPVEGDTIAVGNLIAEFKPLQHEAKNNHTNNTKLHKG